MRKTFSVCKKHYLNPVGLREHLGASKVLSFTPTLVKVIEDNESCISPVVCFIGTTAWKQILGNQGTRWEILLLESWAN